MKWIKFSFLLLAVLFGSQIIWGLNQADIFLEGKELMALTWGKISLVDLYMGFFGYIFLFFLIEPNKIKASLWGISTLFLGNFASFLFIYVYFEKIILRGKNEIA